jgi:hypothetical protein
VSETVDVKYLVVVGDKDWEFVYELSEEEAHYFDEIYEIPECWHRLSSEFWAAYDKLLPRKKFGHHDQAGRVQWLRQNGTKL